MTVRPMQHDLSHLPRLLLHLHNSCFADVASDVVAADNDVLLV
jgi:hypothetical protein